MKWLFALVSVGTALLASCASTGDIDNPFSRKFGWFSYINGDDLRATCRAGGPDRYRAVYNANYLEQVRVYELRPDAGGAVLSQRVIANPERIEFDSPGRTWRGDVAETVLSPQQAEGIVAAFADSGLGEPPPVGLQLPADTFFWIVAACRDGRFVFDAWLWPQARFAAATFPEALRAVDATGIAFNPPRRVEYLGQYDEEKDRRFILKVGADGLVGVARLL